MLRALLAKLRDWGVDVQSAHRRDATSAVAAQRRLLAGRDVRVVFDCGAHRGRQALEYRAMFPGAKIYSFEPTPGTFALLTANLKGVEGVEAINAAVGDKPGTLDFYTREDSQTNSLTDPGGNAEVTRVRVVSMGDFCADRGITHIDLLKMDIEGYELKALMGVEPMLRTQEIDVIYCEVRFEPPAPGCTHFVELAGFLRDRGYRFFGFYNSIYDAGLRYDWGDAIFVSDRALAAYQGRTA